MSSLSTIEQIPTPCSTSVDTLDSNSTSTNSNVKASVKMSIAATPQQPTTPLPPTSTRKRKRRNSTMIIKPARWSPPLHHHHPTNALMASAPIETDFQPTFYNPNEIKHRRRISSQQYGILEDEYQINTKPNASKRHHLAELLGMTPRTVQIWFQNKRAKAKHQQGKHSHAEKKPPTTPTTESLAETVATQSLPTHASSSTTAVLGPVDQFTFDDGRLDPIYLMDDCDMKAFMAASSSPSLSSTTSAGTSTPYITNQLSSSDGNDDDNNNVTAVTALVDTSDYGQQSSRVGDHGTQPTASSASSSPHLPSSDTDDSFAMGLHYSTNTNQHQCYDETPFSASTASSSPCQQFSPLTLHQHHHDLQYKSTISSTKDISLSSMMKENGDDQEQQLRYDTFYILNWMQKTPTDFSFGTPTVPSWPYVMDQPDLQNVCLDFSLDHDDWMDPFSVSA